MMESRFQVILLRLAREDVDSIYEWLTERSPAGASRWYSALLDASKSLETVPDRHALAPEASEVTEPVRQCLFRTRAGRLYRILFVIAGCEVRILRVRGPGQQLIATNDVSSTSEE